MLPAQILLWGASYTALLLLREFMMLAAVPRRRVKTTTTQRSQFGGTREKAEGKCIHLNRLRCRGAIRALDVYGQHP
jgi:hypothetical protein